MFNAISGNTVSVMKESQASFVGGGGETEVITTRFGAVTVDKQNPIFFPRGLLGMPDKFHFCLTKFPSEKLNSQFKLLQSIDDYNLSFIVLPLELNNNIIEADDIKAACAELDMAVDNVGIALIVSVHRSPQSVRVSVNARAPIMMDAERRVAVQYVFSSDKYKVQRIISL